MRLQVKIDQLGPWHCELGYLIRKWRGEGLVDVGFFKDKVWQSNLKYFPLTSLYTLNREGRFIPLA